MMRSSGRYGLSRLLACLLLLCSTGAPAALPVPGSSAPDFRLAGHGAADEVQLSQFRGKVVVLVFWASWCPGSAQLLAQIDQLQARHAARGLQVVAVNVDQRRADADAFLLAHPLQLRQAFDPANHTPRNYGVRSMPTALLLTADGAVQLVQEDPDRRRRAAFVRAVLRALAVTPRSQPGGVDKPPA